VDLADERWANLQGAYRRPYDVRPALQRFAAGDSSVWDELWEELHHQGDIGEASYAAVSEIVRAYSEQSRPDWNVYALAVTVEQARHHGANPTLPAWMAADYRRAWKSLETRALTDLPAATDDELVSSILAVLALTKGKLTLARMAMLTEDEREEMLGEAGWG
jgi:hypothetical protein